jgi:carbonic anhydrase/acetyltransferase-like protein (isoleucine patch superfamily)
LLVDHEGARPHLGDDVYVAPNAVVSGDVRIGAGSRVLFGAVVTAEAGGTVELGRDCVVMEQALIRGRADHPSTIGDHVLVGPNAHINGAEIGDRVFLATGVSVFPGASVGSESEVRINGVIHVNTRLPEQTTVPIAWIAVGDPPRILPPSAHDEIWAIQEELDFPGTVYGVKRPADGSSIMPEITRQYSVLFGWHMDDVILGK